MSPCALAFFQNLFRGPDLIILLVVVIAIILFTRIGRGTNNRSK